jgi:hypothetical protein
VVDTIFSEQREDRIQVDRHWVEKCAEEILHEIKEHRIRRELLFQTVRRSLQAVDARTPDMWMTPSRICKILRVYGRGGSPLLHLMRVRDWICDDQDSDFDDACAKRTRVSLGLATPSEHNELDSDDNDKDLCDDNDSDFSNPGGPSWITFP